MPHNKMIMVYALTVCFAAMFVGAVSVVIAIYDVVQITFPEASNPSYIAKSDADLSRQQQESLAVQQTQVFTSFGYSRLSNPEFFRSSAIQSLIMSSVTLVVSCILFFIHWRMAHAIKDNDT